MYRRVLFHPRLVLLGSPWCRIYHRQGGAEYRPDRKGKWRQVVRFRQEWPRILREGMGVRAGER